MDCGLQYKFTSKSKIYPDGTVVSLYCNKPKFSMEKVKKSSKIEIDIALLRKCDFMPPLRLDIQLDNGYIYTDPETGELIYTSPLLSRDKLCLTDKPFTRRADNVKRTKDKIFDLVALNDWTYFFTGTLGNTYFDPTNAKQALKPLQKWLQNMVSRYGLKYVLVAEYQPKSGRIHFHGFLNDKIKVVDSGTRLVKGYSKPLKLATCKRLGIDTDNLQIVYNVPQWTFGFTTAIKAFNGSIACARYIVKYITKDNKAIFGRYYWSSRNLNREPQLYYEDVDYNSVLASEYAIPHTSDKYKYYTFFPGQKYFHWQDEYKQAQENTDKLIAALNDYEVGIEQCFIPFREVGI